MTRQIVDHKSVDMTEDEFTYYRKLVGEFTIGMLNGKDQFHDLFDVDEDGCIMSIHPPIRKEIGWGVLFFVQNLMINQRLRRIERLVGSFTQVSAGGKDG